MFVLVVLACSISSPDYCVKFEDTRGPYVTEKECHTRAYEMGRSIFEMVGPDLRPISFNCKKLQKARLT